MTVRAGQKDPQRQVGERRTERPDLEAAILIIGSSRGEAFAPAQILICADTLSVEVGIRAWLEAHGIRATG